MVSITGVTLDSFVEPFLEELRSLEARRRADPPVHGPSRDEVIGKVEADLRKAGFEPWQLYINIIGTVFTPGAPTTGIRSTAVNLLHDPNRVPEYAAKEIADTLIDVMQVQGLDYNLGQQTVMAISILRVYDPATPMLPVSKKNIDDYVVSFIEQVPAPRQGQSQAEAMLNHTAHTLASIARFTVVHDHAYDDLLERQLHDFYKAQAVVKGELERGGKLNERGFYAFVHPMEHLAELMDQATMTRDNGLVGLLVKKDVVDIFNALEEQRVALGLQGRDVERYKRQKEGYVAVAVGSGYKVG